MKITNFSKFLAVAFAASSLMLTSCGTDPVAPVPVVKDYAKVMMFHGATDATAVNLQIDGATKGDSIKYGAATAYNQVELTAGKKVVTSGLVAKSGVKIFTDSLLMNKDVGYSFFVYQESDAAKTVSMIKSVDDLALPTSGKARIRLVHLIPDLSTGIDFELVAAGTVATTRSDFTNVRFKDIKNFIDVTPGTYDIKVKLTGTTTPQVLITSTITVTLDAGKLYTSIARGYANAIAPRGGTVTTISNN